MICPSCKLDMIIASSKTVEEDNKKYLLQDLKCRNRNCPNYNRVMGTEKTEIPND